MKLWTTALAACLLMIAGAANAFPDAEFTPLFDGKSTAGWKGDEKLWSIEDGAIAGTTEGAQLKGNTFLATEKTYKNFVLRLKWKLRNGNSGIQFRSKQHDNYRVTGYQADIADNDFLGILYEEGGRGILAQVENKEAVKAAVKKDDWNDYEITADNGKITQKLNGVTTISYDEKNEEKGAKEGVIALQLHVGPPMKIWFKDIEIKELP
ncbi:MAG TPA: DUF1080 domain-containing protein [Pirellulales bacterium]